MNSPPSGCREGMGETGRQHQAPLQGKTRQRTPQAPARSQRCATRTARLLQDKNHHPAIPFDLPRQRGKTAADYFIRGDKGGCVRRTAGEVGGVGWARFCAHADSVAMDGVLLEFFKRTAWAQKTCPPYMANLFPPPLIQL